MFKKEKASDKAYKYLSNNFYATAKHLSKILSKYDDINDDILNSYKDDVIPVLFYAAMKDYRLDWHDGYSSESSHNYEFLQVFAKHGADFDVESYNGLRILDFILNNSIENKNKLLNISIKNIKDFSVYSTETKLRVMNCKIADIAYKTLLSELDLSSFDIAKTLKYLDTPEKLADVIECYSPKKQDEAGVISLLKDISNNDDYFEAIKVMLTKFPLEPEALEDLKDIAIKNDALKNLKFYNMLLDSSWAFQDSENKNIISRHSKTDIPDFSLQEIFNFKGPSGERVSIMTDLKTGQKTPQRESFSQIDDQDLILEAARKLEEKGGTLPENSRYKTKKPAVFPKACS